MNTSRDIREFRNILSSLGAPEALGYLNAGVDHRYTAAYRLNGRQFENVLLHDKQSEVVPEFLAVVPFDVSFCQFVLRDGVFSTVDSAKDSRLDGHPYQGVMVSYHGVPIANDVGELIGTLCHFDVEECPLSQSEFALLQEAAGALPGALERPKQNPSWAVIER